MRPILKLLPLLLAGLALPASATFHLIKVVEVFPGTAVSPNAQYVVIQMYASGQQFVGGHAITVFNRLGGLVGTFTFPAALPNGANQAKILIATPQAETFFGLTADLQMSAAILSAGGKACWAGTLDCVAWGSYVGGSAGVGTPFNASGGGLKFGRAAIRRLNIAGSATTLDAGDDTDNSATDFLAGTPAPRNNAGVLGHAPASACGNGTLQGLEQCDDGNTTAGDGCSASCTVEAAAIPSLSIADVSTQEGNSGTHQATFTLKLSKASPGPVTYNITTANGTATAGSDYAAKAFKGQSIPAGVTSKPFAVTINGDTTREPNETFRVLLGNVNGATVADASATGTIVNDDVPMLSIANASIGEGNTGTKLLTFTVRLSQPSTTTVTYSIATANGSAVAGSDYVARSLSGQSIAAGETSKTFAVTIDGDTAVEKNETLKVNLTNVVGASVSDGLAIGTLLNDDGPFLTIGDVRVAEGDSGTHSAVFTVKLSQAVATPVSFDIATANGTARAGSDYVARSIAGYSIPAGNLGRVFTVTVDGDTAVEPDESFFVTLANAVGATIFDARASGTIANDDTAPATLSIADIATTEGNSGTHAATFTVRLSRLATAPVSYDIATANGTAVAGSDYVARRLEAETIPAGQDSRSFAVTIDGDMTVEPSETFDVRVSNLAGAVLADGLAVGTIGDDDYRAGY